MSKRKLLVAAVALCMVAVLGGGTLAYFTANDNVTNTFDTTADFSIEVTESQPTGELEYTVAGSESTGFTYSGLLPATTVHKDPTVTNTGGYPAYVRLVVTISKADAWMAACEKAGITELDTIFGGHDETVWTRKDDPTIDGNTIEYVYYLNEALEPSAAATLFDTFTVPFQFDTAEMDAINGFTINIKGEAIQTANTGDTVFEAFENYVEPEP